MPWCLGLGAAEVLGKFKFKFNYSLRTHCNSTKFAMTDDTQYHSFIDQILYVKDDLSSEEHCKLINALNFARKNGTRIQGFVEKMMKMKFEVESSTAESTKKNAISDNTLLTFIRAAFKMYAVGMKILTDDSLESFSSKFLKNEYIYLSQKMSEAEGQGDMGKVLSLTKAKTRIYQRYIVELRQIKLLLARECLDLTSVMGLALYNRFERESKVITTAQKGNNDENYQWIDDLLDEAMEGFNI